MSKKFFILSILAASTTCSAVFANDNIHQKIGCGIYEVGNNAERKLISNELTFETAKDGSVIGEGLLSFEAPNGKRELAISVWISDQNEAGLDGIRSAYVTTYTSKGQFTNTGSDAYFLVNLKQNKALFVVRNPLTYFVKGSGDNVSYSQLLCVVK